MFIKSAKDLESQKNNPIGPTPEDIERSRSQYAHAGRGGAGNYTDGVRHAEATALTGGPNPMLEERQPSATGYHGRGGIGNYKSNDAEQQRSERRASELQEKVHQEVTKKVDAGLKEPEKAHLGSEKIEYDTLK